MIPLTLPAIPLSPGLIAPTVLNAAPCLLLCAWQSQLQCHCKGQNIAPPAPSTAHPTPPFQETILHLVGATILTFMATRQKQQWGEEVLHSSLRAWSLLWLVLRMGMGWGTSRWHRLPAPAALPDHFEVSQACWEVGEKENEEPLYSHLSIS